MIAEQETAVAALGRERQSKYGLLEQQRQALTGQLRMAYAVGRQERLKLILNQQDPTLLSRVLAYFGYLSRDRAQRIQATKRSVRALEELERVLEEERVRLVEIRARQAQQRHALREEQLQRQDFLRELEEILQDQERRLSELRGDAESLQRLIERLEENGAVQPSGPKRFSGRRGQLPWPLLGRVTRRFGATKESGLRWDGMLIAATEGQLVAAVHGGRVAFADWLRGFGLLLILDHGDGYMTLYGHNQALLKQAGEWVEVQEPVALSGRTGGRSRPALYFAIRHQGKPVNPHNWLARRGA
jgi:septal ring factor EnvC (AmiA/AmiB activator)